MNKITIDTKILLTIISIAMIIADGSGGAGLALCLWCAYGFYKSISD